MKTMNSKFKWMVVITSTITSKKRFVHSRYVPGKLLNSDFDSSLPKNLVMIVIIVQAKVSYLVNLNNLSRMLVSNLGPIGHVFSIHIVLNPELLSHDQFVSSNFQIVINIKTTI